MINPSVQPGAKANTFDLLAYYSLDADHYPKSSKGEVLARWLQTYPEQWVRLALIESLYQGRYKTFSVEQLLALWHRRGQPIHHFSYEFASLVTHDVPRIGPDSDFTPNIIPKTEPDPWLEVTENAPPVETINPQASPKLPHPDRSATAPAHANSFHFVNQLELDPFMDGFDTSSDTRQGGITSINDPRQLLPLTVSRMGLVPIHQFMPEAEPIEFCDKLAAIAHAQS